MGFCDDLSVLGIEQSGSEDKTRVNNINSDKTNRSRTVLEPSQWLVDFNPRGED